MAFQVNGLSSEQGIITVIRDLRCREKRKRENMQKQRMEGGKYLKG